MIPKFNIENIKTGVISVHSVSCEFIDDIFNNGIDLDFEAYIAENGDSQDVIDLYEMDEPEVIMGFIKGKDGKYVIDPDAELSVIYNGGLCTIQIVKSEFVKTDCVFCSPCYPDQGDLDSNHGNVVCYCVDPEDLNDNIENETSSGIVAITKTKID